MKIGIISDTHDHQDNVQAAVKMFNEKQVAYVLHAGDLVSPFTAKAFSELVSAKFIAVYGNNDGEKLFLKSTINGFGGEIHEYCYKGVLHEKQIYMTHTHHNLEELIKSQLYDLVIYGHTHETDIRKTGRTLVVNPGESTNWLTGMAQAVILDLEDMSYKVESLP